MERNPLGNLPAKAARMWESVFESVKSRGADEGAAAAQAWCAVKREYYKKGDRWLKRKRPVKNPPGCTPVRKTNSACCTSCEVGKPCDSKTSNPGPSIRKLRHKLLQ